MEAVPEPPPSQKREKKHQSFAFLLKVTVSDLQLRSGRSDWNCSDSAFPVILLIFFFCSANIKQVYNSVILSHMQENFKKMKT